MRIRQKVQGKLKKYLLLIIALFWIIIPYFAGIADTVTSEQLQEINQQWEGSIHALNQINCSSCHLAEETKAFIAKPNHESCQTCHEVQVNTFLLGKHGIRLNEEMSPLQPKMASIPMKADASDKIMNCNTCHDVHSVNTYTASVDACLTCHNDSHSLNYVKSKHSQLFAAEGQLPRPSVESATCATCHLPRQHQPDTNSIFVNHNNTYNLLPRDRMVADVCMNCHGMEYSYNSIFDDELVTENFSHPPTIKLETLDLVRQFEKQRLSKDQP
ncbi:MAG: multiheme c-type cytochrome [Microcystaceae cyanobacterium]